MTSDPITLGAEAFAAIFPFHFAFREIDQELRIIQIGRALPRAVKGIRTGARVDEFLRLKRPEVTLSGENLAAETKSLILLEVIESGLLLRGQITVNPDGRTFLFLGSPWIVEVGGLREFDLSVEDFAIHDPAIDLLQMLQFTRNALTDAKRLASRFDEQRRELRQVNERLSHQNEALIAAEARLRARESEASTLAMVAARTDNAVVLTDAEGKIVWVNEGFVRLTGYTLGEAAGRKPGHFLQGSGTDQETIDEVRRAIQEGDSFSVEILNYARDGREYWVGIDGQPIRDEHGTVTHFMAIERDVTARRESEAALERAKQVAEAASEAKSAFLASVSHEIRTPLTAVIGYSDMILRAGRDEVDPQDCARRIAENASHLLAIVNDILDLSKVEAGRLDLHPESVSVVESIESVIAQLQVAATEKALHLEVRYDTILPRSVFIDPVRFRQILINLVSNATRFTDAGRIDVIVAARSSEAGSAVLEVEVRDTGIGIPAERVESIFNTFEQVEASPSRRRGGTGLGLDISRRLARLMGGNIWCESKLGHGSSFHLTVALGDASALEWEQVDALRRREAVGTCSRVVTPSLVGMRILVADDSDDNRRILSFLLAPTRAEIRLADDGAKAVELALEARDAGRPFDLVLLDMLMPVMDGYTAARRMRGERACGRIIAMTALAMAEDAERCLAAGCDGYFTKPILAEPFLRALSEWVVPRKFATPTSTPALAAAIESWRGEYIEGLIKHRSAIVNASKQGDLTTVLGIAHRLSGTAQSFGFDVLSSRSRSCEEAIRGAASQPDVQRLVDELLRALEDAIGTSTPKT